MPKKLLTTLLLFAASLFAFELSAQCLTINCPSNITVNNDQGNCSAISSYTAPIGANSCGTGNQTFSYTGSVQTFVVPSGITALSIDSQGAQGGGANGGNGGRAQATMVVTPGETLNIYVGGRPASQLAGGGFNGGGTLTVLPCGTNTGNSFPGGGASDVRRGTSLSNRVVVAGGGGGQGWSNGLGGTGGGSTGADGQASWISGTNGKGGTSSAGGAGGYYTGNSQGAPAGTFGIGGNGNPINTYCTGGGGGGGWYGGGGGYVSAGGGGSSYVGYSGNTSTSTTSGYKTGNGQVIITWTGGGSATTTQTVGLGSGQAFPLGSTTETYQVSDGMGGTATCSFTVTVNDNEVPAISCPSNMNMLSDSATCGAFVNYSAPVGTDNCTGATTAKTAGLGTATTFPIGTSTETYTVTDGAGLTASCSFTVTITDGEAPSIVCPQNITVSADSGICSATSTYSAPVGTDNCTGAPTAQIAGLGSGSTFPVGVTIETYQVTDAANQTATCSFVITVSDNENPTITCLTNISVNNDAGQCTAVVVYGSIVGTDNCSGATTSLTAGLGSGSSFPIGTTTEIYQVMDGSGNSSTCSFDVVVNSTYNSSQTLAECDGFSIAVGNSNYNSTGTYSDTLLSSAGCDSVVTTNLTVDAPVDVSTTVAQATITANATGATYKWLDCNSNSVISGETGQSYTAISNGSFAVIVTVGNCSDTSACETILVDAISENTFGSAFTLYPNPNSGKVNIDFGQVLKNGILHVFDASGRLVHSVNEIKGSFIHMELTQLSQGNYFVKVQDGAKVKTMKLIIE